MEYWKAGTKQVRFLVSQHSIIPLFHYSIHGFFALLLFLGSPGLASAQNTPTNIYQAEANLICLLAKYTEWPKESFTNERAPFVFGILGKDPFEKHIDFIKGQKIKNRPLLIKYYNHIEEVEGCHLLFISSSEKERLPQIIKTLGDSSTLTVADLEGFTRQSGMITIVPEKTREGFARLRYEVNQQAAEKARLRIDSYVLAKAGKT